jgi:hypothetical protein
VTAIEASPQWAVTTRDYDRRSKSMNINACETNIIGTMTVGDEEGRPKACWVDADADWPR